MEIFSWSSLVVAVALFVITAYLAPILARRLKFVGSRYRIVVASGGVFILCSLIELFRIAFFGYRNGNVVAWMMILDYIQATAIVIMAGASVGYIDIAFTHRKRTRIDK